MAYHTLLARKYPCYSEEQQCRFVFLPLRGSSWYHGVKPSLPCCAFVMNLSIKHYPNASAPDRPSSNIGTFQSPLTIFFVFVNGRHFQSFSSQTDRDVHAADLDRRQSGSPNATFLFFVLCFLFFVFVVTRRSERFVLYSYTNADLFATHVTAVHTHFVEGPWPPRHTTPS